MFCPSCGKQIPDQSSFCMVCGNAIHAVAVPRVSSSLADPPSQGPVLKHPQFRLVATVCALVVAFIGVGAVLWTIADRPKTPGVSSAINLAPVLPSPVNGVPPPKPVPAPVALNTGQIAELATPSVVVVEDRRSGKAAVLCFRLTASS
jgi:hypothetical protein